MGANSARARSAAASISACVAGGAPTMTTASNPAAAKWSSNGVSSPKRCSTMTACGHSISTCFLTSSRYSARSEISSRRRLGRIVVTAAPPSFKALEDFDGLEATTRAIATLLLSFVGTLSLQALEIFGCHVARDVLARETRGIEVGDLCVVVANRVLQIVQILINQPVGADDVADLFVRVPRRHEFRCVRHVDAVDVGVPHRRRG